MNRHTHDQSFRERKEKVITQQETIDDRHMCVCASASTSALFIHSHDYWKLDNKSRAPISLAFTIH